jgi:plasmid stabilization system protein ParE
VTPLRFHEAAENELRKAIGYFETQRTGLGRRFLAEVRRARLHLTCFPESAPEIGPGIRKYVIRKFRFSLIYSVEDDGLLVLAVAHNRRHPEYWVGRIHG